MDKTNKQIENLKRIGYTQDKIDKLMNLLAVEIEEKVFDKLIDNSTEDELNVFKEKLVSAGNDIEKKAVFEEAAQKALGNTWKEEVDKLWSEALETVASDTLKVRETYQKYMDGDPATIAKIKEIENSQELKDALEDMKKDGFDFQSEAAK